MLYAPPLSLSLSVSVCLSSRDGTEYEQIIQNELVIGF